MKPQQVRDTLAQTLEDHRLSRAERASLKRILDHVRSDQRQLANYRSIAFDLARDAAGDSDAAAVLDWLEGVVKLLHNAATDEGQAVTAEACFSPGDNCPRRIGGLLAAARHSVDICVFTITDDRITDAILAAHERGVAVRIITDDDKAADLGSDATRLARAGIEVRLDRSQYHMHHKFALFDRSQLLTGSYNWTRGAAENNEENFIITGDLRLIEPFADLFDRLWNQFG